MICFKKKSKCAQGSSRNFCHASRLHRCPLRCRSCHWCGALWQGGSHRYRWGRRRWWPASHVWHEGEIETMNSLADVIRPQKTKLLELVELLSLSGFQNLNDITHHCYILYSCHLAAIYYLYSFLHQHDFSSLFHICSCSNAVSTFNTLSHHTLPTDQNRLNIKHKRVETQVWSCLISHVPPSSPLVLSMWYGPGFAIITWNNPKKWRNPTVHHQGTKPVNLWGLFSHVTRCLLWWTPG